MSDAPQQTRDDLSPTGWLRLDEICKRFEQAWKADAAPRIQDHLDIAPTERPALFRELLAIELELRRKRGDVVGPEEYRRLFPEYTEQVDRVFSNDTHTSKVLEQLGRYRLLTQLGQGGMGTVYLAQDTKLDRRVAIKVLPAVSVNDAGAVARFQREAKALAKLSHPGIVQAFDSEAVEGRHFLVMEYVEGTSLADVLKDKGAVSPARAADYTHQAALALHHAHEKGLVHRDLKPSNLLLSRDGQVKILDLGLARFLQDQIGDPSVTREGAGLGTPDYASPEQFRDARKADVRSDIYALGCTIYHLLAGQVPFPGSSLAEKLVAHEVKEPAALEKLCPEIPGGLTLVVARMMAKDPAERFQSALEVAQALAPFAAGSSVSFQSFKNTASWQAGQLTVTTPGQRRTRAAKVAALAMAAVLLLASGVWLGIQFFTPGAARDALRALVPEGNKSAASGDGKNGIPSNAGDNTRPSSLLKEADVLTVSKDPRDGGEYRMINDALVAVDKPGKTIRVLDAATYEESLTINQASLHSGLTVETARGATLAIPAKTKVGVFVFNVPRVTVRGFRIRCGADTTHVIVVANASIGVLLEELEIHAGKAGEFPQAISLESLPPLADTPAVVRNCRIHAGFFSGIRISGWSRSYQTPHICGAVVVRDNRIGGCSIGINCEGAVDRVHVVGNQVWDAVLAGIQLENLLTGTKDVLVANNTLFQCRNAFRLWDDDVKGKNIQIRNNLTLGSRQADMIFEDSGGDQRKSRGPGDGKLVAKAKSWQLDHNWREAKEPKDNAFDEKAWIPPAEEKQDVRQDEIKVLSRLLTSADFLRPNPKSSLATANGAGRTDPSLPSYVGAVPPKDVRPWDWTRTWQAPPPGVLLTVSKQSKDSPMYRTIGDAIKAAKPWATIRVLDDETYDETVVLDSVEQHRGISLEAPRGATLVVKRPRKFAIVVQSVAHVRVSGFRMRQAEAVQGTAFVKGEMAEGLVLEDLDLLGSDNVDAIKLYTGVAPMATPMVIRRCAIQDTYDGIVVWGQPKDSDKSAPTGKVVIQGNRIFQGFRVGIIVHRGIAEAEITGNVIWKQQRAIQLENIWFAKQRLVVANNTLFGCGYGFWIWMEGEQAMPGPGCFLNNLMFDIELTDIRYFVKPQKKDAFNGDYAELQQRWGFFNNARGLGLEDSDGALRRGATDLDARNAGAAALERNPAAPTFVRPAKDSPLATKGAGPLFGVPAYIGAIPPEGVASSERSR
jgi:predicted Ser/Thr protein kinase